MTRLGAATLDPVSDRLVLRVERGWEIHAGRRRRPLGTFELTGGALEVLAHIDPTVGSDPTTDWRLGWCVKNGVPLPTGSESPSLLAHRLEVLWMDDLSSRQERLRVAASIGRDLLANGDTERWELFVKTSMTRHVEVAANRPPKVTEVDETGVAARTFRGGRAGFGAASGAAPEATRRAVECAVGAEVATAFDPLPPARLLGVSPALAARPPTPDGLGSPRFRRARRGTAAALGRLHGTPSFGPPGGCLFVAADIVGGVRCQPPRHHELAADRGPDEGPTRRCVAGMVSHP